MQIMEQGIELVGVANDGEQILNIIKQKEPDIVLLDIIMPHLDGMEVLERIKLSTSKRPKIIALTALGQEKLVQRIFELGVDYYLIKPFNLDVMTKRIRQLLRAPESERTATSLRVLEYCSVDAEVTTVIRKIGIPPHVKGYQYLREAITMIVGDVGILGAVTKELYPMVARKYFTTPSSVETAIRHSIGVAWTRGNLDIINGLFGYTINMVYGKPSNVQFMALIADKLRMEMRA